MPTSRADRRLLLMTGAFVALAGVMVAAALFLATRRDAGSGPAGPLTLGTRSALTREIKDGGSPLYFASPFDDVDGFWLDLEDGALTALVLDTPEPGRCVVKWKEQRNAYVDCHDVDRSSVELDRYRLSTESRDGQEAVVVDLRRREPAPAPSGSGG